MNRYFAEILILSVVFLGCSSPSSNDPSGSSNSDGRISPVYDGPDELEYCGTVQSYSGDTVTITGSAKFEIREPFFSGSGGLGEAGSTVKPIRYAEVRVTNGSGNAVQCAETDASGNFSFILPEGSATYTISVNSRGNNNQIKASVLDAPERNQLYSVTKQIIPDSSKSAGTLRANADGDTTGGAFNILDQIYETNEFLRDTAGNCSAIDAGCDDFTVAPKVLAYWELGFNPGSYYNADPVSFYLPSYSRLFILGGVNGNSNSTDTDHFDNSIIIHEYGHFLEDVMGESDSPGGPHYGNQQIDARLAWSEGFANFLNAAVRTHYGSVADANYIDTTGNSDGSTGFVFAINLESYGTCNPSASGCDKPQAAGEGIFREFAISRYLYDVIDNTPLESENSETDNVFAPFAEIWASLVMNGGFTDNDLAYRDVGLLNYIQEGVISGATDWGSVQDMHGMPNEADPDDQRKEYAHYVNDCTTPTSFTFTIDPVQQTTKSYPESNLQRNNDFFWYKHSGGSLTVSMTYVTSAGVEADLDLIVYDDEGPFGYSDGIVGSSTSSRSPTAGDTETETINLGSLAAGDYLINVFASDANNLEGSGLGDDTDYEIFANGDELCPKDTP